MRGFGDSLTNACGEGKTAAKEQHREPGTQAPSYCNRELLVETSISLRAAAI